MKPRIKPRVCKLVACESPGWYVVSPRTSNGPFKGGWEDAMTFAWTLYWAYRIMEKY